MRRLGALLIAAGVVLALLAAWNLYSYCDPAIRVYISSPPGPPDVQAAWLNGAMETHYGHACGGSPGLAPPLLVAALALAALGLAARAVRPSGRTS